MASEGRGGDSALPPPLPILPRRAVVTPRARPARGGESLPLHVHVTRLWKQSPRGLLNLFGPRGSGKTAALQHLAAVLPPEVNLLPIDQAGAVEWPARVCRRALVLVASREPLDVPHAAGFEMSPWT